MAAKPIDPIVIEKIIADWRTGEYSQRQLVHKYKVSAGKIAQITKGLEKDCERIVSAGVIYKQGLANQDERIVSAINEVVDYKLRVAGLASTFVEKAIIKATSMLDTVDDAQSIKHLSDSVDKNTITAGINERHAKPTQINNTSNTQNNYAQMNDDDLVREVKQIRDVNAQIV